MLGIGIATLLGAGGLFFWRKIAVPFSRVLEFSEDHNQESAAERVTSPFGHYVPQELYTPSTDLKMTHAMVKLSTAVNSRAHNHAIAS